MFTQLLCCRSRFGAQSSSATTAAVLSSKNVLRHIAQRNAASDKPARMLGQTTILVQQGGEIQELPVIMRKIGHDDITALCATSNLPSSLPDAPSPMHHPLLYSTVSSSAAGNDSFKPQCDADAVIRRLNETDDGLLSILAALDELTEDELQTPDVARYAFKRLHSVSSGEHFDQLETSDNASFERLLDAFATHCDTQSLLEAMSYIPRATPATRFDF